MKVINVNRDSLIGKGMKFPFEPNSHNGVATSESIDRINQSLFIIFETPKGSRLNMPDFGSNIHLYRFDPFDNILLDNLKESISEDIRKWEPRISLEEIRFLDNSEARDNHILYISINYTILNGSIPGSYVYPYRRDVYDMSNDTVERW